jgi:hypothetical protein
VPYGIFAVFVLNKGVALPRNVQHMDDSGVVRLSMTESINVRHLVRSADSEQVVNVFRSGNIRVSSFDDASRIIADMGSLPWLLRFDSSAPDLSSVFSGFDLRSCVSRPFFF